MRTREEIEGSLVAPGSLGVGARDQYLIHNQNLQIEILLDIRDLLSKPTILWEGVDPGYAPDPLCIRCGVLFSQHVLADHPFKKANV